LFADRGDALAFNAHIGNEAGRAGTIDDRAATQQERGPPPGVHEGLLSAFDHAHCRTG
jgi:hypothetical protein